MNALPRSLPLDVGRWTLNVGRFLLPLFFSSALLAQNEEPTSGYGPPTAIPPETSLTRPAARPPQNWIDQSQAQADAKSAGCNQCHNGVEPMHKASHVVLGCTDCHGGNAARGLTKLVQRAGAISQASRVACSVG